MNESLDRLESLFAAALQQPPADRAAYLDQACADDQALRQRVDALLRAQVVAGSFLESPPPEHRTTAEEPPMAEKPEMVIGPYKLLGQIGEGGFGIVFLAEQQEPIRRRVALKIIKPGMDSRQVIARFEAERQALALMDHPNIARVIDAGETTSGRPFFVMELVMGLPITEFCDQAKLPPRARLALFASVCQAVQHAHQKGIIHRDIKPTNVLVTMHDDKPVPKVIDFGIAKATGAQLTEKTLFTNFAAMIGTPLYMSPEQAGLSCLDIDTRSDIYSLGVLLYELLTGTTPFTKERFKQAAYDEIRRIIREEEPPKPSTRLSDSKDALPSISAQRQTEPAKLTKLVRGELDWIVMKALEKDRNRRYETANSFAMDVQRYLADEPVLACPPSTVYRFRKFVRRYRGPVLAAALVILALVAGIVGTTIGLVRAEQARQDAVTAQEAEAGQRRTADEERAIAQAVNDFLQKDLLGQADLVNQTGGPGGDVPLDPDIKVRTVLDRAARTIGGRFGNQPRVEAAIRLTIAKAYFGLGYYKEARPHAERSAELRMANLGADHIDTLTSNDVLADLYYDLGFVKQAETLMQEVLEKRTATLGPDHLDTLTSKHNLALFYVKRRECDRAEPLLQDVVQKRVAQLGAHQLDTLWSKLNLAWLHTQAERHDVAAAQFFELQSVFVSKFGEDHPGTLLCKSNLGLVYNRQGKYAQAEPLLREVLEKRLVLQGPLHTWTLSSKSFLAGAYCSQQKYDQAVPLLEEALTAGKVVWGEDHRYTLNLMHQLGFAYRGWGKPAQARTLFEQLLTRLSEQAQLDDVQTQHAKTIRVELACMDVADKKPEKAIAPLEQALAELKDQHGIDDPQTLYVMWHLARALLEAEQSDKAVPLVNEVLDRQRKRLGAESSQFAFWLASAGQLLLRPKHFPEAEKRLRESQAIRANKWPEAWSTFNAQSLLGAALLGQKKYAEAEPLLVEGYQGMRQREPMIPAQFKQVRLTEALERLVQLYDAWGKPDEAAKWRKELEARTKAAEQPVEPKDM